ncbi:MAG: hypothetical protein HN348_16120, partial [Proteobacteria bacterium]|nr:hypothetical protein [Pseudomonadota bacterium]
MLRRIYLALVLIFAASCPGSGPNLKAVVAPPLVTINQPSENSSFAEGTNVLFVALAQASRADLPANELLHEWVTGNEVMCESNTVLEDGTASCSFVFTDTGEVTITITVTDPEGETASDTVTVDITTNTTPTIEIVKPIDQETYGSVDLIAFECLVDDAEDDPDELTVTVESSIDGPLTTLEAHAGSDGVYTDSTNLTGGNHQLTFAVTDTLGKFAKKSIMVNINSPPDAPEIEIIPDPAQAGDQMNVDFVTHSYDPDNDKVTYEFVWSTDGVPYGNPIHQDEIAVGETIKNQFWEVYVTPVDGVNRGNPAYDSITIVNKPPYITDCNISPIDPANTDDLAAVPSGWFDFDGDPPSYEFQWLRYESANWVFTGITGDIYSASLTVRGDEIRVVCIPFDGEDSGVPVTSATVTVSNAKPSVGACDIFPSDPTTLDDLVATPTTVEDDDNDPVSVAFTWTVNGILDPNVTDDTYPNTGTETGDVIDVECIPHDGHETGKKASASATIVNSAPVPPEISFDPESPVTGDPLEAVIDVEAWDPDDGDTVSYSYEWYLNGLPYNNPTFPTTNNSISSGILTHPDYVEAHLIASDGTNVSAPAVASVTVANSPPSMTDCEITPSFPGVDDKLTVAASGFTDPENQPEGYHYEWYRLDNSKWKSTGVTSNTFPKSNTTLSDEIKVKCIPFDGLDEGTKVWSSIVLIGNSEPSLTGCSLGPANPTTTDDLIASGSGYTDPDGDPDGYTYRFVVDGVPNPTVEDETFFASETEKGQEIYAECYPYDGYAKGTPLLSSSITIQNTAPTAPDVDIHPAAPITGEGLSVAIVDDASDDDGDTLTYYYYWFVDGTPYLNPYHPSTNPNISPGIIARDE